MAQPKKLTLKQKQEKKLLEEIATHKSELMRIKLGMKSKPGEMSTWRWAALEVFKDLKDLKHPEADKTRELALKIARDAQGAMNFN